jgi:VanZ family protein
MKPFVKTVYELQNANPSLKLELNVLQLLKGQKIYTQFSTELQFYQSRL